MLRSTFYTGKKRNFSFEKYAQNNKNAHTMMEYLNADKYSGLDERSKKYLVHGIKTSALDTVKATISESVTLRTDFECTVDLFKKIISQHKTGLSGNNNVWASSTTQNGGGGSSGWEYQGHGHGCVRGRGYQGSGHSGGGRGNSPRRINGIAISDRYYNPNEFEQKGNEGRAEVLRLHRELDENQNQAPAA